MSKNNLYDIDNFKDQIPYYLTRPQKEGLMRALEDFPEGTNYYLGNYPEDLKTMVLQGDVFKGLPIYAKGETKRIKGIVLSNSCDISPQNKRDRPMRALFAPLVSLERFKDFLRSKGIDEDTIIDKIDAIKKQIVTNVVYLPENGTIPDSLIFLDDIYQISSSELCEMIKTNDKLITLSQVGFYILLFKISLHFCRFHENVARYNH